MKRFFVLLITIVAFCSVASAQTYLSNPDGVINIRAAASNSSKVVCKWSAFDENSEDALFLSASGDWYKVKYKGKVGYIHFSKVQATSRGYKYDCVTSMSEVGYLKIYKSASKKSGVVGKMPNYGVARNLGSTGNWYKIKYNGIVGYVSSLDGASTMW